MSEKQTHRARKKSSCFYTKRILGPYRAGRRGPFATELTRATLLRHASSCSRAFFFSSRFFSRAASSNSAAASAAALSAAAAEPLPLTLPLAAFASAPLAPAPSPSAVAAAGNFNSFFISFNSTLLMCMFTTTALFDGFGELITGTGPVASATRIARPKALRRHKRDTSLKLADMRKSSDTPAFDRDRDGALVRDLRAAKLMRVREDAAEAGFGISNAVTKQFGLRGGGGGGREKWSDGHVSVHKQHNTQHGPC